MTLKLYEEEDIKKIAKAIRLKNGKTDSYTVSQMATAIFNIPQTAPASATFASEGGDK